MTFQIRVGVRGYELDLHGHVHNAVYLQYGDHARWECIRRAGVEIADVHADGLGPINLETTIRYQRELRGGDEVDVSCEFEWGTGKTFRVRQELRLADGSPVAEIISVSGLLDLAERRLVANPQERWRALASSPELMGL
ncbi:acyl-CoA thioesterase [Saccharopolyspora taberi]|uniref:Acyl-CoA thioesterase n=1 Tax=Saccharopolyspora taberi TaxID=60895 RepID=A0ABN3V3G7_9PSEU